MRIRWIAYGSLWLTFALLWALAAFVSSNRSAAETLLYGCVGMATAAVMGTVVWRQTGRLPLGMRSTRFYVAHGIGLVVFSATYASSWLPLEIGHRGFRAALHYVSPTLGWNALMGSWLYLMIAGAGYAVRAENALQLQQKRAAEATLLAQQAQLAALRAQVNPHFLFNALHSVGALIGSDPAKADLAVERLGDLLRYALGTDDAVPFRDEWRFTMDYLAFEHLRLGDRLTVVEHVDESAYSVFVPPLVLQPLVENAVRHGIADRPEGGRIELTARVEETFLLLRVCDDGYGQHGTGGLGVGLASLKRRLAVLHGDAATVEVTAGSVGCTVTIRLPADDPEDSERT